MNAISSYITVPEFARRLGITRQAVHKLVQRGRVQADKIGRDWLIREPEIELPGNEYQVAFVEYVGRASSDAFKPLIEGFQYFYAEVERRGGELPRYSPEHPDEPGEIWIRSKPTRPSDTDITLWSKGYALAESEYLGEQS